MKLNDVFSKEDSVLVDFQVFYAMMQWCAERSLMLNAVKCEVPYVYIREMMTGEPEKSIPENWEDFVKLFNETVEGDEDEPSDITVDITVKETEGEEPEEE